MKNMIEVINFIKEIEKLKSVTRTAWTSSGRNESTAEHSWRLAVFLMLMKYKFEDIDINKCIKMSLIHDLGEIYDGDISAKLEVDSELKLNIEERAMNRVLSFLSEDMRDELFQLWNEYNECESKEAKLVKALDKIETIIQHNQGDNPKDFDYEFNLNYGKKYCEDDERSRSWAVQKALDVWLTERGY